MIDGLEIRVADPQGAGASPGSTHDAGQLIG
jgi:hypothetical protein